MENLKSISIMMIKNYKEEGTFLQRNFLFLIFMQYTFLTFNNYCIINTRLIEIMINLDKTSGKIKFKTKCYYQHSTKNFFLLKNVGNKATYFRFVCWGPWGIYTINSLKMYFLVTLLLYNYTKVCSFRQLFCKLPYSPS